MAASASRLTALFMLVVWLAGCAPALVAPASEAPLSPAPASQTPAPAAADPIVVGRFHTCALTSGGGVQCWGFNELGSLGDGTTTDSTAPVHVSGLSRGVVALATGRFHTCALTSEGGVKCWGFNEVGNVGDGTTTNRTIPVDVSGLATGIVDIASGSDHSCALTVGGGVRCWGFNDAGGLGDGTTTHRATPVEVSGLSARAVALAAGVAHTCALTGAGGIKCWGFNEYGQLGDGTITSRTAPADVSGLSSGVVAIAAGINHTCALTNGGGIKCWGYNGRGELGDGTNVDRTMPVDVSGLSRGVLAIAAGWQHTCALTSAGAVKCWGNNSSGELGNGTTTDSATPVEVSGLSSGAIALATGGSGFHNCVGMSAGGIKCWGLNDRGQLGDGTTTNQLTPVEVAGFGNSNQ